jgi:ABC-type taurine transport system ATPase subunit
VITRLIIKNFKRFGSVEIDLGSPVVFIGPNDSGKTTALQALALWDIGLRRWNERRSGRETPDRRPGVTVNRRDLLSVPDANLLWRDLHVRDVRTTDGRQATRNVRIDILVEGVTNGKEWRSGLEFDYANPESFYCRPLRLGEEKLPDRMPVPAEASAVRIAFLPPMSGLAAGETRLDPGAVNVRLGEGRTAEVLRNLCYQVLRGEGGQERWRSIQDRVRTLFGVSLSDPEYVAERGEITMAYETSSGVTLDLSSAGRGLQQTLLLLTHMAANPGTVLLLDEPDAHLEILRPRQVYSILTETAEALGSQVIAASHSEVILNEAAGRDVVVAFVGKPHRIDDRGSQLLKPLKEIGFEHHYQAEQKGWVLYLEGSTDLAILRAFAAKLSHPAGAFLELPFAHHVGNQPAKARERFHGLREAKRDLVGFALVDRLEQGLQTAEDLTERMWGRREIENYLTAPETLLAYAEASALEAVPGPIFEPAERERRREAMRECIEDLVPRAALRDPADRWLRDTKATGDFLDRLFPRFFERLGLPNLMNKTSYHVLARHVPAGSVDPEIAQVLDPVLAAARRARPVTE